MKKQTFSIWDFCNSREPRIFKHVLKEICNGILLTSGLLVELNRACLKISICVSPLLTRRVILQFNDHL